ncbi:MAG: TM2 domain-containing protein [Candidatus Obscuribacterales bacterium]|nr:TM2 domain-containing protein [Candidatus Obscuribacterales bacterium]
MDKEISARRMLAEVLEKLGKIPEAADQYRIISQESQTPGLREHWLKKSQDLLASSHLPFDELFKKEEFRPFLDEELRYVPLYCSGCKRLFTEAETFSIRRKFNETIRCWCGVDDKPIAKDDAKPSLAFERGKAMSSGQRAKAIYIAGAELADGKKQSTACLLALTLGWCGGHKFYLGEIVAGWIYLLWFWTLVPLLLSLYEAMLLSQMSLTTFNMSYNLDVILLKILSPEEKSDADKSDVFSLEFGETKEVG